MCSILCFFPKNFFLRVLRVQGRSGVPQWTPVREHGALRKIRTQNCVFSPRNLLYRCPRRVKAMIELTPIALQVFTNPLHLQVDVESGRVVKRYKDHDKFGEGCTILNNTVYRLT